MEISIQSALPELIEAARHPDPLGQLHVVLDLNPHLATGSITRAWREDWTDAAQDLSDADLAALIRLITLAEESLAGWGGGSVSPVIWLFRVYARRTGAVVDDLADWILANSSNDYVPFGTSNLGAKSLSDLEYRRQLARERKKARADEEAQRRERARLQRSAKATKSIFGAIRRGDTTAIHALLDQGADLTATDEEGRTPLAYARHLGREAVAALLAKPGESESDRGTV